MPYPASGLTSGFHSPAPAVVDATGSVGTRIREFRRERGWTQDDLATATGVSRSAVAQWETDRAGQVRSNLTRIADALGISVEVLLYGAASRASAQAVSGDEWALLRLYRECDAEDRSFVLRAARRLTSQGKALPSG